MSVTIVSIIKENGIKWTFNRSLYSAKLKGMKFVPATERLYEKSIDSPQRLNIFDIDVARLQAFIKALPDEKKRELICLADDACAGIIKGFSSVSLDYSYPIDWQLNPLTGKRCNENQKWYQIPDFDKERGDIKVIWEISRFSHFVTLARAYLLTEDTKYYKAFSEQLEDWLIKNPYTFGANYKCGQECSLRMTNALLAYTIFDRKGQITIDDTAHLKMLIYRCYKKILANFFYAYKCIKNNHTISELLGMMIGAWCCKDEKRVHRAYQLMDAVIDEQFFDDGGYRQYSFNYQRLALQDLECVLLISKKTGIELSEHSKQKINKSAYLLFQCQDETGDMPNYGSNDGALIFPVTSCGYRDFRPVIGCIFGILNRKRLYNAGIYDEEFLWFGHSESIDELEQAKMLRNSMEFPDAGLFTLRNANSWGMIVLNNFHSRPAHMDQLHFDLWVKGVNVLCDTGTHSYASDTGKLLKSTQGHNTVYVENKEQMNAHGAFMVSDWTKRKKYVWEKRKFSGHMISKNGYEHIRKIRQSDSEYIIQDNVRESENKQLISILFHTPCQITKAGRELILENDGEILCRLTFNAPYEIQSGKRSLYYLKEKEISVIKTEGTEEQPLITKITIGG